MKYFNLYSILLILIFSTLIVSSCNKNDKTKARKETKKEIVADTVETINPFYNQNIGSPFNYPSPKIEDQISQFVRRIFQDSRGNYWFGTNGDGVIRYKAGSNKLGQAINALEYFSLKDGFNGYAVRAIVEDKDGNIWFGSDGGLIKYDSSAQQNGSAKPRFKNYTVLDGLINNDVWSMAIDSDGVLWIGTLEGVSLFDGETFSEFILPETEPDYTRGVTSSKIIHSIREDSKGKMWFGSNGGAFIYDPSMEEKKGRMVNDGKMGITNISEKDGLCNNSVNDILEDKDGNIWFATHHKGVCKLNTTTDIMDNKAFTHFTSADGIKGIEAWSLFEDSKGNIWFPIEGPGVYRIKPSAENLGDPIITNFGKEDGLATGAVQCIFEDKEGRLLFGGYMGLFMYDGETIVNLNKLSKWPI